MNETIYTARTCRVCLNTTESRSSHYIFHKDETNVEIAKQIETYTGIKIDRSRSVACLMCPPCYALLTIVQKFYDMCQKSNVLLQGFIRKEEKAENVQIEEMTEEFDESSVKMEVEFINTSTDLGDVGRTENSTPEQVFEEQCIEVDPAEIIEEVELGEVEMPIRRTRKRKSNTSLKKDDGDIFEQPVRRPEKKREMKSESLLTHMCDYCGNAFRKRSLLLIHLKRHTQEKMVKCELCDRRFITHSELTRHFRTHTGEKPFKCRYCDRIFGDRSSSLKHERTHTNERPFACTNCDKSFMYSNVLKNHMLTHTGVKNFKCEPCQKIFSRTHQLKQHMATSIHKQVMRALKETTDKISEESPKIEETDKEIEAFLS